MGEGGPMRSMSSTSVKVVIVKFIEFAHIDAHSSVGVWFSPTIGGTRPPPCAGFSLTSIDNHRAVLFGGYQPECGGAVSDLYIIDFLAMV